MEITTTEKYSRGRRGAPAKGVGRATGARVQIPPAPLTERKRQSESSGCLFLLYDIMSVREGEHAYILIPSGE